MIPTPLARNNKSQTRPRSPLGEPQVRTWPRGRSGRLMPTDQQNRVQRPQAEVSGYEFYLDAEREARLLWNEHSC